MGHSKASENIVEQVDGNTEDDIDHRNGIRILVTVCQEA
jgi:hypothetical protein